MKTALKLLSDIPWSSDAPELLYYSAWLELVAERARIEMRAECVEACHQEYRDDGTAQRIEALIRALPVKPGGGL